MEEKNKWNGLGENELLALVVILLVGILFWMYFTERNSSAKTAVDSNPIAAEVATDSTPTITLSNGQTAGDLSFSGTAQPNAGVSLIVDGNAVADTTADSRGEWAVSHTISEPGRYAAYARVTNLDGRTIDSPIANFRIGDALVVEENDADSASGASGLAENAADAAADNVAEDASSGDTALNIPSSGLENRVPAENVGVSGSPTIRLPGDTLLFGAVSMSGTARPRSNVEIFVDGKSIAETRSSGDGTWEYYAEPGSINYGHHAVQVVEGDFASPLTSFMMRAPETPVFDNNLDGVYGIPDQYRISGTGTPSWKIQYSVNGFTFQHPTDINGNWEDAEVMLMKTGCYQFELAALDANGEVVPNTVTGPYNVIITEDGNPVEGVCPTQSNAPDSGAATGEQAADGDAGAADSAGSDNVSDSSESAAGEQAADGDAGAADSAGSDNVEEDADIAAADAGSDDGATEAEGEPQAAPPGDDNAEDAVSAETATAAAEGSIGEVLQTNGNFNTLLSAIESAGLSNLLMTDAPLTMFAPTDEAFAALPTGAVDNFLANPEVLRDLLTNHLVEGALTSEGIANSSASNPLVVTSALGSPLQIVNDGDQITVNGVSISQPDLSTGSATIHAIDHVILPGVDPAPMIDDQGVSTFKGNFLTIVGTGAPTTVLIVMVNGEQFGDKTVVDLEGNWTVSGDIPDGQYEIIAYTYTIDGMLPLAASNAVNLTVLNE